MARRKRSGRTPVVIGQTTFTDVIVRDRSFARSILREAVEDAKAGRCQEALRKFGAGSLRFGMAKGVQFLWSDTVQPLKTDVPGNEGSRMLSAVASEAYKLIRDRCLR